MTNEKAAPKKLMSRVEYDAWLKGLPDNFCPFCDWRNSQIVLYEGHTWVWVANIAPYWRYHTMFIPKRHITELTEVTVTEMGEFFDMYLRAVAKLRATKLLYPNGQEIKKYLFFWRLRDDPMDYLSGNLRPNHFHMHMTPDQDHLFEPVLDQSATAVDINQLVIKKDWF